MIIAIEGIDGAGKNTLVSEICSLIDAPRVATISFPRYDVSLPAQLAARALHGEMGDLTDSVYGMATLFALDRQGALPQLRGFIGGLDRGLLILDRYVASNAAYSQARLGQPDIADWVFDLEFSTLGLPQPDLQILLATEPEEAQRRAVARAAAQRERARDAYERDGGLQDRTFMAYQELAKTQWASPWLVTSNPAEVLSAIQQLTAG